MIPRSVLAKMKAGAGAASLLLALNGCTDAAGSPTPSDISGSAAPPVVPDTEQAGLPAWEQPVSFHEHLVLFREYLELLESTTPEQQTAAHRRWQRVGVRYLTLIDMELQRTDLTVERRATLERLRMIDDCPICGMG